jgi:serine/threonine-protein kinase
LALLNEQIDGKYEILGKLREGGMGAIYKVRHRLLDEVRVVKVIRSQQADAVGEAADRFLAEARSAIKLRHPNVAVLHDFAVTGDGQAFIVMEYIDGWNLLEVLSGFGPPPISLTLEIARQSLKALGYLHRHKIVHRDVSPDNLMLTRDVDGHPLVKLIDLGIAKSLGGQSGLTTTGVFLGKPRYGSPERFGGGAWDERSDLYSFGVVLYELLTGRAPVTGSEPAALMAGHLFRPPLDFAETDPQGRVPLELRAVALQALAKKPEDRIASAEAFIWALTMLQDRFPLNREDLDQVWDVLLPLGTGSVPVVVESPGSTQDRLDLEFGLAKTPATGTVTAESALRTAAAGSLARLAEVVPFPAASLAAETRVMETSQPTRRVTPVEDLDSTWSSRPLRTAVPAETPAPVPASPEPLAAGEPPRSRPLWINAGAAAGILLALAAGGLWWSRRPAPEALPPSPPPAVSTTIATVKSPAVSVPIPAAAPVPAPVVPARPPVSPPVANPALETPRPKPPAPGPALAEQRPPALREPLPEEPAPAVAPEEAMKPGDLIRAGQPGVQPPEIRALPSYVYPAAAKGSGRKVSVRLAVLVDENGRVIDARVREGDKPGLGFDEAALEAARKARYFPATRGDVPGKMWTDLRIDFAE